MAGFKIPMCLLTVLHSALVSMYKPTLTFKGHFLHLIFFLVNKLGLFSISVFPSFFFFLEPVLDLFIFCVLLFSLKKKQKTFILYWVFPGGSDDKESACNAGELG